MTRLWFLLCLLCIVMMNDVQGNVSDNASISHITSRSFNVILTTLYGNNVTDYVVFVKDWKCVAFQTGSNCSCPDTIGCSKHDENVHETSPSPSSTLPPSIEQTASDFSSQSVTTPLDQLTSLPDGIPQVITVDGLLPSTTYQVEVFPCHCDTNTSLLTTNVTTDSSPPGKVTNIAFNVKDTDIIIKWLLPVPHPGPSTYFVFVEDAIELFESHDLCNKPWLSPSTVNCSTNVIDGRTTNASCNVTVSKWFWAYKVHILASTLGGNSTYISSENLISGSKAPGPVQKLQVDYNINSVCNGRVPNSVRQVCVKWNDVCPTERNDFIVGFTLVITDTKADLKNGYTSIIPLHHQMDDDATYRKRDLDKMSYEVTVDVQLYVNYTVTVFAKGQNIDGVGESITICAKAIKPQLPKTYELRQYATVLKKEVDRVEFALTNTFFFVNSKYGDVIHKGFIVSRNHQPVNAKYENFDYFPSWRERGSTNSYAVNESKERGLIILGDGDCSQSERLCDGALDSDTDYEIGVYICTRAGCSSEQLIPSIRTLAQEPNNAGYIAVIVICALILLASAVFVYFCIIRKQRVVQAVISAPVRAFRKSHYTRPIPLDTLESVISEKMKDDCLALREEFRQIEEMSTIRDHGTCMLDTNRHKNRFADIVSFDHSRVRLSPDDDGGDYINANFIHGYNRADEFIACQGPLSSTTKDMWRMVWEHRVPVIVMLTQTRERFMNTCEQYWPDTPDEEETYSQIVVLNKSVTKYDDYTKTVLSIKNVQVENEERQVLHFHYLKWPDKTADVGIEAMLNFVSTVRQSIPSDRTAPVIVHCSAGVGRTGTFISIDYVSQFIRDRSSKDKLDIFGFVNRMRQNRCLMVQRENQYIFIYECARYLLASRKKKKAGVNNSAFTSKSSLSKTPLLDSNGITAEPDSSSSSSIMMEDSFAYNLGATNKNLPSYEPIIDSQNESVSTVVTDNNEDNNEDRNVPALGESEREPTRQETDAQQIETDQGDAVVAASGGEGSNVSEAEKTVHETECSDVMSQELSPSNSPGDAGDKMGEENSEASRVDAERVSALKSSDAEDSLDYADGVNAKLSSVCDPEATDANATGENNESTSIKIDDEEEYASRDSPLACSSTELLYVP